MLDLDKPIGLCNYVGGLAVGSVCSMRENTLFAHSIWVCCNVNRRTAVSLGAGEVRRGGGKRASATVKA